VGRVGQHRDGPAVGQDQRQPLARQGRVERNVRVPRGERAEQRRDRRRAVPAQQRHRPPTAGASFGDRRGPGRQFPVGRVGVVGEDRGPFGVCAGNLGEPGRDRRARSV
jgi:hypothetical protein